MLANIELFDQIMYINAVFFLCLGTAAKVFNQIAFCLF